MKKLILTVDGMSCRHCVNAVTKAVLALSGVNSVNVDLSAKTVTVDCEESAAEAEIREAIEYQGYDVL